MPNKERYDFKASALYHNLGISYFHIEQYAETEKYLFRSLELQEKDKDTVRMVSSYMDIANLYYAQYKDNEAIPYFEKAYQLSKKTKDFELKQNSALNMAVMEENRKQFSRSLEYHACPALCGFAQVLRQGGAGARPSFDGGRGGQITHEN